LNGLTKKQFVKLRARFRGSPGKIKTMVFTLIAAIKKQTRHAHNNDGDRTQPLLQFHVANDVGQARGRLPMSILKNQTMRSIREATP